MLLIQAFVNVVKYTSDNKTVWCRDHREHLEDITNNLHNDQRWLKRTKQVATGIQNLIFQGRVVSRVIEKAKVFNQYFSSTFTKEDLSNVDKLR